MEAFWGGFLRLEDDKLTWRSTIHREFVITKTNSQSAITEDFILNQENRPKVQQSILSNVQAQNMTIGSIKQESNAYWQALQSTNMIQDSPPKRTILTLASSPVNQARLRLDKEVSEIKKILRLAKYGVQFSLEHQWAVRVDDLQDALLNVEPEIVHFCGHGAGVNGLALENEMGTEQIVSTEALARLFRLLSKNVRCVVLNACYSEVQAEAIHHYIDYVVGMNQAIGDEAAINFSKGFYRALGNGKTFEEAYDFGCNAIDLQSLPDYLTPVLKKRLVKATKEL